MSTRTLLGAFAASNAHRRYIASLSYRPDCSPAQPAWSETESARQNEAAGRAVRQRLVQFTVAAEGRGQLQLGDEGGQVFPLAPTRKVISSAKESEAEWWTSVDAIT